MAVDTLSQALSNIMNAEKVGKTECIVQVSSKLIMKVLDLMKNASYIAGYEYFDDKKGGLLKISLNGAINKCGVIKPRFSFTNKTLEKYERRYLPAKGLGFLVVSTPKGIMPHTEARKTKIGGKLISYVY